MKRFWADILMACREDEFFTLLVLLHLPIIVAWSIYEEVKARKA